MTYARDPLDTDEGPGDDWTAHQDGPEPPQEETPGYRLVHGIPTPGTPVHWQELHGHGYGHYIGPTLRGVHGRRYYRVRDSTTDQCWWSPEGDLYHHDQNTPEHG